MSTIDGRSRHHGSFYGLPGDPAADVASGPVVIVHGNCEAASIRVLVELARRLQAAIGVPSVATDPGRVLLGEVVAPPTVHDAQMRWYLDNPQVVAAGTDRHADALALLGAR